MAISITQMMPGDWSEVSRIYKEGIDTGNATFETAVPLAWDDWSRHKILECCLVARGTEGIIGWAALSHASPRKVYVGVAEVSIYVSVAGRGNGVGAELLRELIHRSELCGIWTLQAAIFPENHVSVRLHERCGFRAVGVRQRLARMAYGEYEGKWRDILFLERRSAHVGLE